MFKNFSSEQIARIVSAIIIVMGFFGYTTGVEAEQLVQAGTSMYVSGAFIVAFIMDVFGYFKRYAKGDVTLIGARI